MKPSKIPAVHYSLLQYLAPVSLAIEYAPVVTEPYPGHANLDGPIRYTFKNTAEQPIKLAFPPLRAFSITKQSASRDQRMPNFSKERRIVTLQPSQSISFVDHYATTITGFNSLLKYSTGCWIARMRSQNSDISRYFASRLEHRSRLSEVEKCQDGIFQQAVNPAYFNGGIGFTGFVFGVPEGENPDEFCTGSVFPVYRVVENSSSPPVYGEKF